MADVEIILKELKLIFNNNNSITKQKEYKILRLKQRLENERIKE